MSGDVFKKAIWVRLSPTERKKVRALSAHLGFETPEEFLEYIDSYDDTVNWIDPKFREFSSTGAILDIGAIEAMVNAAAEIYGHDQEVVESVVRRLTKIADQYPANEEIREYIGELLEFAHRERTVVPTGAVWWPGNPAQINELHRLLRANLLLDKNCTIGIFGRLFTSGKIKRVRWLGSATQLAFLFGLIYDFKPHIGNTVSGMMFDRFTKENGELFDRRYLEKIVRRAKKSLHEERKGTEDTRLIIKIFDSL